MVTAIRDLTLFRRSTKIGSSSSDIGHLRKIYDKVKEINTRATELELEGLTLKEGEDPSKSEDYEVNIKTHLQVGILIHTTQGGVSFHSDETVLNKEKLPNDIDAIFFDNKFAYKSVFGLDPKNSVTVTLHFFRRQLFDFQNETIASNSYSSGLEVVGQNENWADGAFTQLKTLLLEKKNKRAWLHTRTFYFLFHWVILIPFFLWVANKLNPTLDSILLQKPDILRVTIYVYVFFSTILAGRVVYNYLLWLFPSVELIIAENRSSPSLQRWVAASIIISLVGAFIYDVLKSLL